jgi:hypothetical protein
MGPVASGRSTQGMGGQGFGSDFMVPESSPGDDRPVVELKDRTLAVFLAWLWPGAGHIYQGRHLKGLLYMATILGTFVFGFLLGDGRVVYAAWKPDFRWPYVCQVWVGLPALPALVEARRAKSGKAPLWRDDWYAPPGPMGDGTHELDHLLYRLNRLFEYGTVYTMIAGLLNVLAIYDAGCGPAYSRQEEEGPPGRPPSDGKGDKT